jgi:hypothetical protein
VKNIKKIIDLFLKTERKKFDGSMDPTEVLGFLFLLKTKKITNFVESGRQYGYSTLFLSKFANLEKYHFTSIDIPANEKIKKFCLKYNSNSKYVSLLEGDFYYKIRDILKSNKKIAILVDGPKGLPIYIFSYILFNNYKNLEFIFFDNFIYSSLLNIFFKKEYNIKNLKNLLRKDIIFNKEFLEIEKRQSLKNNPLSYDFTNRKINDFAYICKEDVKKSYFRIILAYIIFIILRLLTVKHLALKYLNIK